MNLDSCLSIEDLHRAARARLPKAVYGYVSGGTEDGASLRANLAAFDRVRFRPRGLAGIAQRSQQVELWGHTYASPFGISPMGATCMCRDECDLELARAAKAANIPFTLSGLSTVPMETVQAQASGIWYQGYLPGDIERIGPLMDRLQHNGIEVIAVTIDTAVGANRENNQRVGFTIPFSMSRKLLLDGVLHPRWTGATFLKTLMNGGVPRFTNVVADPVGCRITEDPPGGLREGRDRLDWSHLAWMRERWGGKLVLKGVAHPADAALAVQHGLDGVIVSNHGGRQLDGAQGSLDALPDVVAAVPADFPVFIDGGFRRGTDILKALLLGARMVFMGRPMLYGASVAGEAGVAHAIRILQTEVDRNLALLGCRSVAELTPDLIVRER